MNIKPTIHITNWSSPNLHGPGRKINIMERPRYWEFGDGRCRQLTPSDAIFDAAKNKPIDMETYRTRYIAQLFDMAQDGGLQPNSLCVGAYRHPSSLVLGGDTLLCACSKAAASRGECHRVWAAEILVKAGWNVILDGKEIQ